MKINNIIKNSKVNGPGTRYTIWVQGCSIHCDGCLNQDTWDFNSGKEISAKELMKDVEQLKIDGISITGGEPLDQYKKVIEFLKLVYPKYNILLTTGYTLNEIEQRRLKEILDYIDILITGPFVQELIDTSDKWRGSTNQKISFLTERSKQFKNYISKYRTEIKINKKTGEVIVDGFYIPDNIRNK